MPTAEQGTRTKKEALCNHDRHQLMTMTAALFLSLTLIWAVTAWNFLQFQKEVQSALEATTSTLARTLGDDLASRIAYLELAIKRFDHAGAQNQKKFLAEAELLKKEAGDQALQISIAGSDGIITHSTLPHLVGESIAGSEHFRARLTPPMREVYVGKPILRSDSSKRSFQLTSPIIQKNRLAGAIVISLEAHYVASFFHSLALAKQDSIDVIRADGTPLAHYADDTLLFVHDAANFPITLEDSPISGNFRCPSHIDGIERIYGYYKLSQYGLIVVVGSAVDRASEPFKQTHAAALWQALLVSALLVLLVALSYATLRRHDNAKKKLNLAGLLFNSSSEAIFITDDEANILAVNESFYRITGFPQSEIVGQNPRVLASGRHGLDFYKQMWNQILSRGWWEGEIWNRKKDGTYTLEWLNIKVVRDLRGAITNYIGVFANTKKITETQQRINFLAMHDELTQLPNRAIFYDRLQNVLGNSLPENYHISVAFIDIDDFKTVNDSLGHAAGDNLLKAIALRIASAAGPDAVVSRFGGDEFTLLLENADAPKAAATAQQILESLRQPFSICGFDIYAGVSIGIAAYPQHGKDINTLLQNADLAMYHAKGQGKNTFSIFNDDLQTRAAIQLQIENGLPRAIAENQLILHYQPQVELDTGRVVGLEALVRWQHPYDGLLLPEEFIPQAEKSCMIDTLGEWVADKAAAQIGQWRAAGLNPPKVSINISSSQFLRGVALPMIERILKKYAIPPHLLAFELTESALMTDSKVMRRALKKFRDLGLEIFIDDFGAGFSSLSSLCCYPINALKINQSFVRDMNQAQDACATTQTVIDLAKYLGIASVAEGVESEEQFTRLKMMGCNVGQGFFFATALSVEELECRGFVGADPAVIMPGR